MRSSMRMQVALSYVCQHGTRMAVRAAQTAERECRDAHHSHMRSTHAFSYMYGILICALGAAAEQYTSLHPCDILDSLSACGDIVCMWSAMLPARASISRTAPLCYNYWVVLHSCAKAHAAAPAHNAHACRSNHTQTVMSRTARAAPLATTPSRAQPHAWRTSYWLQSVTW
jgi:hypothetical protein